MVRCLGGASLCERHSGPRMNFMGLPHSQDVPQKQIIDERMGTKAHPQSTMEFGDIEGADSHTTTVLPHHRGRQAAKHCVIGLTLLVPGGHWSTGKGVYGGSHIKVEGPRRVLSSSGAWTQERHYH